MRDAQHPARLTVARSETKTRVFGYSTAAKPSPSASDRALADLMAKPRRTALLGNSPYICSPSGFGRKSSCFLR